MFCDPPIIEIAALKGVDHYYFLQLQLLDAGFLVYCYSFKALLSIANKALYVATA